MKKTDYDLAVEKAPWLSMFKPWDSSTHEARLKRIRELSPKGYIDDGAMALYNALNRLRREGCNAQLEYCLQELERLYNFPPLENA